MIDHAAIFAQAGLPVDLVPLLEQSHEIRLSGIGRWELVPVGIGSRRPGALLGPPRRWITVTPFVAGCWRGDHGAAARQGEGPAAQLPPSSPCALIRPIRPQRCRHRSGSISARSSGAGAAVPSPPLLSKPGSRRRTSMPRGRPTPSPRPPSSPSPRRSGSDRSWLRRAVRPRSVRAGRRSRAGRGAETRDAARRCRVGKPPKHETSWAPSHLHP
jgi:hypothetical protein